MSKISLDSLNYEGSKARFSRLTSSNATKAEAAELRASLEAQLSSVSASDISDFAEAVKHMDRKTFNRMTGYNKKGAHKPSYLKALDAFWAELHPEG